MRRSEMGYEQCNCPVSLKYGEHYDSCPVWSAQARARISALESQLKAARDKLSDIAMIAEAVMYETDDPGGCCCKTCSQPGVREARRQLAEEIRAVLAAADAVPVPAKTGEEEGR
jgi:hypothetical protein